MFDNTDKVRVAVLFGTEFGFSQEIAEYVVKELKYLGYWPVLHNMAKYRQGYNFEREQLLLVACST